MNLKLVTSKYIKKFSILKHESLYRMVEKQLSVLKYNFYH